MQKQRHIRSIGISNKHGLPFYSVKSNETLCPSQLFGTHIINELLSFVPHPKYQKVGKIEKKLNFFLLFYPNSKKGREKGGEQKKRRLGGMP